MYVFNIHEVVKRRALRGNSLATMGENTSSISGFNLTIFCPKQKVTFMSGNNKFLGYAELQKNKYLDLVTVKYFHFNSLVFIFYLLTSLYK